MRVEAAASESPCREWLEAKLGRLLCADLAWSDSITPGPIDFLGAFAAGFIEFPDIGGYWLVRRVRVPTGAAGGSIIPDTPEAVEEALLCRVDVLCLRRIEPDRRGRTGGGREAAPRPSITAVSIVSCERFPPTNPRSPPDAEN